MVCGADRAEGACEKKLKQTSLKCQSEKESSPSFGGAGAINTVGKGK